MADVNFFETHIDLSSSVLSKTIYVDSDLTALENTKIKISLRSNNFGINDVIAFDGFRDIFIVIWSEPIPLGVLYDYDAMLLSKDINDYKSLSKVDIGTHCIKTGILIDEGKKDSGGVILKSIRETNKRK